jgi:hypothetical protein
MRSSLLHLASCLSLVLVACGGGGGGGAGGGGGGGGGNGLGPSGTTCGGGGANACYAAPGNLALQCQATNGPNVAVMASDYDHVLTTLNTIRTNLGLPTFTRTAALDNFANSASTQLMNDHVPHAYFNANYPGGGAFTGAGAENQGDRNGWPANTTTTQINEIINCFMAEGTAPAGTIRGHWETIVCPCYTKIGVGLVKDANGLLYLSIEFSA